MSGGTRSDDLNLDDLDGKDNDDSFELGDLDDDVRKGEGLIQRKVKPAVTVEERLKKVVEVIETEFSRADKSAAESRGYGVDTQYYLCVVFQSVKQKIQFIEETGMKVDDGLYTDGLELAKRLNVELLPVTYRAKQTVASKRLRNLASEGR